MSRLALNFVGEKAVKVAGVASDGELWMSKVLKTIDKLEADTKHVTLRVQPSPEARELQVKAREILLRLREVGFDVLRNAIFLLPISLGQDRRYCPGCRAASSRDLTSRLL